MWINNQIDHAAVLNINLPLTVTLHIQEIAARQTALAILRTVPNSGR